MIILYRDGEGDGCEGGSVKEKVMDVRVINVRVINVRVEECDGCEGGGV